jgi:cation diffusion facilitator CzcD-associated flavoprotein CzcO
MGSRGTWEEDRRRETEFRDRVPSVIIIGAGHIGLETAARLKHLGVSTLVVEKNKRVGDNVSGFIAVC